MRSVHHPGAMIFQLTLGAGLILVTILIATAFWIGLETALHRLHHWFLTPPHRTKLTVALLVSTIGTLVMISASVWTWAIAFRIMGIFDTTEASLYFALVSFTTLGFGDVLLPQEWRLLGGMTAANGFLTFGLVTALLVETMRNLRQEQRGQR